MPASSDPGASSKARAPKELAIASPAFIPLSRRPSIEAASDKEERETKTATSRTYLDVFGKPIEIVRTLEVHP